MLQCGRIGGLLPRFAAEVEATLIVCLIFGQIQNAAGAGFIVGWNHDADPGVAAAKQAGEAGVKELGIDSIGQEAAVEDRRQGHVVHGEEFDKQAGAQAVPPTVSPSTSRVG